ncbi:MAG: hypothetical protein HZC40_08795 [Chloroflexi bacterium]|nr:hypothetical protein [Chloroflexota bacterium]
MRIQVASGFAGGLGNQARYANALNATSAMMVSGRVPTRQNLKRET